MKATLHLSLGVLGEVAVVVLEDLAVHQEEGEVLAAEAAAEDEEGPGGPLYSKMIITQDGNSLDLLPAGESGEGQPELSFDIGTGPEEVETPQGPVTREARWEESELVIHELRERETRRGPMTIEQQQRWTLSEDGKKLTQEIKTRTPMRDFELF